MNLKKLFTVTDHSAGANLTLLVMRVVAGLAFVLHGWPKIQNPFGWMGSDAFAPGPLQALAALSEFGGGLCWILGFLMPLSSLGIGCTMVVAVYMHAIVRGDPLRLHRWRFLRACRRLFVPFPDLPRIRTRAIRGR